MNSELWLNIYWKFWDLIATWKKTVEQTKWVPLDMSVTLANIRATLDETAEEEGELVCYLVDSPRNACYCIFVTFARSRVPFCVHCNTVFSIASLGAGRLVDMWGWRERFLWVSRKQRQRQRRPSLWNAIQKFNSFPNYSFVLILNFSIYMQNKGIWGNLLNWKNKITNNRTSLKRHKILSIAKIPFRAKKMLKVAL